MLGINNYYTFVLGAADRKGQSKGEIGCVLIPACLTWGKEILEEYVSELGINEQGSGITMNSRISGSTEGQQLPKGGTWAWQQATHQAVPQ